VGAIHPLSSVARLSLTGELVQTREWLDDGVLKDDPSTLFFAAGETLEMALAGRAEDSIQAMGGAVEQRPFSRPIDDEEEDTAIWGRSPEFAPDLPNLVTCDLRASGWAHLPEFAFAGCSRLEVAQLADVTIGIGGHAFQGCASLVLVRLPANVTTIGDHAFLGCSSLALRKLPSGVTAIRNGAFWGCSSLALRELPSGVTTIGKSAFENCSSLALRELPWGVTTIGGSAFENCSSLALRELPSGVTTIGGSAFCGCRFWVSRDEFGRWRITSYRES
jgi:hypothetical protein